MPNTNTETNLDTDLDTDLDTGLERDLASLEAALARSIEHRLGNDANDAFQHRRTLARAGQLDELADDLRTATPSELSTTLRAASTRFHLSNQAEQIHIARVNRSRAQSATPHAPRPESLADTVFQLADQGMSRDDVLATLALLDIRPTLTAHPTEARRRAVMHKQRHIAAALRVVHDPSATPIERRRAERSLSMMVGLLSATDDVRAARLRVIEEARNGLFFLQTTIRETVPRLYHDLADAVEARFGTRPRLSLGELPTVLTYGSWIGGDRDGNPRVTPDATRETLALLRTNAIDAYRADLEALRRELSISDRLSRVPDELIRSNEHDLELGLIPDADLQHPKHEPFRVKVLHMVARLDTLESDHPRYTLAEFLDDLKLLARSLHDAGLGDVAEFGVLADLTIRAQTFGFRFASLDIRQHSARHERAVAELLRAAGVHDDYASLAEPERAALLAHELENPRPLVRHDHPLSEDSALVLDVYDIARQARAIDPDAIGTFIISMTHEVSDLLEVLLMMKERGLLAEGTPRIPVVPLFETVDDLRRAPSLLRELFACSAYRDHLDRSGAFQEIMLGYSDSNKDGGYWSANWSLHTAEAEIATVCREHGLAFRLFHGRGGTVGRGGGRANRAILATPPASRNGRIRFTEQGEIISFRYALPELAHRHLEQIVGATLLAAARGPDSPRRVTDPTGMSNDHADHPDIASMFDAIAEHSMAAYRDLIDDPAVWDWYTRATPVKHIANLPIASRPVLRDTGSFTFDALRAIPWVFAWTQTRLNIPGWFGTGAGIGRIIDDDPAAADRLAELYRTWEFFRTVIDNVRQEMARARLAIAERYDRVAPNPALGVIRDEFERARRAIQRLTGDAGLLDNRPVIQHAIDKRNPDTDLINLVQIELLTRLQDPDAADRDELSAAMLLSLNALAAAMQSTG